MMHTTILPASHSAQRYIGDTLTFSGFEWIVKDSHGKQTGPGTNYFSSSKDNVRVDEQGRLHLRVTHRNDKWWCPEVQMLNNLGYGSYVFHLESLPQPLDKDVVIGLFLYDHTDSTNFHNEVDIELSTWGKTENNNGQYVVQPHEEKAYRFSVDLFRPTAHRFDLHKKKIHFESTYTDTSAKEPLIKHKYKTGRIYKTGAEKACINVWLYKATETSNLKEFEVIIRKVEFTPFKMEEYKPALPPIKKFWKKSSK